MAVTDDLLAWTESDNKRFLHVVYRVGNLEETIKFYTESLGMKLLRTRDIPAEKYTNAFLGYGPEDTHFVIELTYNYGVEKYNLGTGFGHFGISVEDVHASVELIKSKGGKILKEPSLVEATNELVAFVEDPDSYKFALIQRADAKDPFSLVALKVGDLDKSISFYEKAFGLKLFSTRDNPEQKYTVALLGYGTDERDGPVLELTYNYGVTEYDRGNAYAQIAIGTDDVYKTAKLLKEYGGKVTREPGPIPGINTKITAVLDPDGWKTVFVDNADFLKELE